MIRDVTLGTMQIEQIVALLMPSGIACPERLTHCKAVALSARPRVRPAHRLRVLQPPMRTKETPDECRCPEADC